MNEVTVNGRRQALPPGATLAALLQQMGLQPGEVATAVNGEFVARPLRGERVLRPGDAITCFQPIVGG